MAMTLEQQKALALAQAQRRRAEAGGGTDEPYDYMEESAAGVRGVGKSLTFGFLDEIDAMLRTPGEAYRSGKSWGEQYDSNLTRARGELEQSAAKYPTADIGGQLLGGAATMFVPGAGAANVLRGATTLGRAARLGGVGMAVGGATGFGEGEGGFVERAKSAATGAAVGGATGAVIGGAQGALAGRAARRAFRRDHTSERLFGLSDDAYDELDAAGDYTPDAMTLLSSRLRARADRADIDTELHRPVWRMIERIERSTNEAGLTNPRRLEEWRKQIKSDLMDVPGQRRAAMEIRDELDDFLQSGEGGEAAQRARGWFRRAIQLEKLEDAVNDARDTARRSSGDEALHIKTRVRTLLRADQRRIRAGKPPQYDEPMREQMERIAETGSIEEFVRWVGKFSPESGPGGWGHLLGGTLAAIPTGGSSLLWQAPVAAAGFAARRGSNAYSRRQVDELSRMIHGHDIPDPQISERSRALIEALTRGLAAQ